MAYRFDEDGSGQVVAEAKRDGIEAYLGLHYPATDIPAPARRMFSLSWVRHLPDVDYVPVPLVAAKGPTVSGPVDMSFASLRSVSVMYTGYLRNMGVRSSMVMPLMKEGRLWGLISAMHHQGPRHIPHETRMAAEFLAHTLSLLMSAKEDAEGFERVLAMRATMDRLVQVLTLAPDFDAALSSPEFLEQMLGQVEARGVAVAFATGIALAGETPSEPEVLDLVQWIATQEGPVFATDRLPDLHPPAVAFARMASGLLAARIALSRPEFLLWFRPEQVAVVNWAGDPQKPVDVSEADGRLRPRASFALWKESVRNRSTRWTEDEKDAVLKLRQAISGIVLGRAGQVERAEAPQPELEGFAHAASQELKDQLRGVYHLATVLRRRHGDALDEEGRQQLATILKIIQRMDSLADSLMEHARIGQTALGIETVDLDEVVEEALQTVRPLLIAAKVEVRRPGPLGMAAGDRTWLGEVFGSLIDNAVRYNDKAARWIEIGAELGPPTRYYVRDNGIGIAEADQQMIFQAFHRLHGRQGQWGGSGIGLAFARKIVERHGGRMWVDSVPDGGSTFTFTLAPETHG
jgi:light-regulated signal transduction histidine kinase (bacteriophytochrome)